MNTSSEYLSTQEVASLLGVTETTVKRWADNGELICVKSVGGHRKFFFSELTRFAEVHGYPISGSLEPPVNDKQLEAVQFSIHTENYHRISKVLFDEALRNDPDGFYRLLHYVAKHNVKLSTIADEVLRPLMVRVGDLWSKGKLRVDQEHRTSRTLTRAIMRLAPQLHRKQPIGRTALCACLEGEEHEIGLLSFVFALENEGFTVNFVGANTPTRVLLEAIREQKPDLVCISFMRDLPAPDLLRIFRSLSRAVRSVKGKLVAGGFHAGNFTAAGLHCDHLASSVTDGLAYVRDAFSLKPGPKKGRVAV